MREGTEEGEEGVRGEAKGCQLTLLAEDALVLVLRTARSVDKGHASDRSAVFAAREKRGPMLREGGRSP